MGLYGLPGMRIAALDIGTNTVLLFIADVGRGMLSVVRDVHAIARIGEGVDRTHYIGEAAYQRFLSILREHQKTIAQFNCDRIVAAATSAMRDAENRDEIIHRTKLNTGIDIEILSGEEEAHLTYRGAIVGMEHSGKTGVVDIGGGSTEISVGDGNAFTSGVSLDFGALRLTERYFTNHPIPQDAREAASVFVKGSLRRTSFNPPTLAQLIAVAGTATTLAAMQQKLQAFDAAKVHGYTLRRNEIEYMLNTLFSTSTASLLERFPSINKSRADILPAGTLILAEVMDYLGTSEITVSTQGLRYGIALNAVVAL